MKKTDIQILNDKLGAIRRLTAGIWDEIHDCGSCRIPEMRAMLNAIFDRVMQLEYELLRLE